MDDRPPLARRSERRHDPAPRHGRATWVRAGAVLTSAFLVWLVMDSVVLYNNAKVIAPEGARRQAALDFLNPIQTLARWTGLALPVEHLNEARGLQADGGFPNPTVPSTSSTTTTTLRKGAPTTTTTFPQPTPRRPLRILLVGDSIGTDLDYPLLNDLAATGRAKIWTDDVIDTGLTRLDYYNWIAHLAYDVYLWKPDVIVGMIGANDSTGFVEPTYIPYGSAAWKAKYRRNVNGFFTIATQNHCKLFWLSVPMIGDTGLSRSWQLTRDIQEEEAGKHHVFYINSDKTLDPGGTYHAYLRVGGGVVQIRTPDGIHLQPAGAALLASVVMADLQRDLRIRLR